MSQITVYSYRRCPFAIRVRMTLHEKGIPFATIEEKLRDFSPELLKLHPEARVPVLVDGDVAIYESAVITEYLDDQYPEVKLMPESAVEKMQARLWTYWCNQIFKPQIDIFKYGPGKLTEEEIADAQQKLSEHLAKLEARLSEHSWLVGEQFSLADIHVFPFVRQLFRATPTHPDFETSPALVTWLEKILARPAFEKTMEKVKV